MINYNENDNGKYYGPTDLVKFLTTFSTGKNSPKEFKVSTFLNKYFAEQIKLFETFNYKKPRSCILKRCK